MRYNCQMQYILDGHNLIPKISGLSLSDPEDEIKLMELLNRYHRLKHTHITVYFDRAPIGMQGVRKNGSIRAVFVPVGRTADSAIMRELAKLKSSARGVTVVSSDRQIQAAARERHANILSSEEFAQELENVLSTAPSKEDDPTSQNPEDIEEWLRLFSGKSKE